MKFAIGFSIFIALAHAIAFSGLSTNNWSWATFIGLLWVFFVGYSFGQANEKEYGGSHEKLSTPPELPQENGGEINQETQDRLREKINLALQEEGEIQDALKKSQY